MKKKKEQRRKINKYPIINHNGKEYEKECIYVKLSHFSRQQ